MPACSKVLPTEAAEHRAIAVATYNHCWELPENPDRTLDEDLGLLTEAFASRCHWAIVGQPEQWICGDWMISRAAAAIGEGDLSVTFAHRAYAAAGDQAQRDEWWAIAEGLVLAIADDDRTLIESQLASVPRP